MPPLLNVISHANAFNSLAQQEQSPVFTSSLNPHIDEDAGILVVIVKRHFDNAKQTTKKDALAGS